MKLQKEKTRQKEAGVLTTGYSFGLTWVQHRISREFARYVFLVKMFLKLGAMPRRYCCFRGKKSIKRKITNFSKKVLLFDPITKANINQAFWNWKKKKYHYKRAYKNCNHASPIHTSLMKPIRLRHQLTVTMETEMELSFRKYKCPQSHKLAAAWPLREPSVVWKTRIKIHQPSISNYEWKAPITNSYLLSTYSPTQLINTIAWPVKDQEKAVETSQSAKSGYPLEKR